jgi:hypothetical protein
MRNTARRRVDDVSADHVIDPYRLLFARFSTADQLPEVGESVRVQYDVTHLGGQPSDRHATRDVRAQDR